MFDISVMVLSPSAATQKRKNEKLPAIPRLFVLRGTVKLLRSLAICHAKNQSRVSRPRTISSGEGPGLQKKKKKNYAGSENHSPHKLRKRSHFGTEYCKAPPP